VCPSGLPRSPLATLGRRPTGLLGLRYLWPASMASRGFRREKPKKLNDPNDTRR